MRWQIVSPTNMPGNDGAPDPASHYCLIKLWNRQRQIKDYPSIGLASYDYDAGAWYVNGHVPFNQAEGYINPITHEVTHWIYLHDVLKEIQ